MRVGGTLSIEFIEVEKSSMSRRTASYCEEFEKREIYKNAEKISPATRMKQKTRMM